MYKIKTYLYSASMILGLSTLLFSPICDAASSNINVNYTGWTSVGANEVQVDADKITIENADVTFNGDNFTKKEFKADEWTRVLSAVNNGSQIIATSGITFEADTETIIPGSIELRWSDAARLRDGSKCDVYMKVDNVTVQTPRTTDDGTEYHPVQEIALLTERNDYNGRIAFSAFGNQDLLGVQFDVTIKVFSAGTDNVVEKNMVFGYEDIDFCDRIYMVNNYTTQHCWGTTDVRQSESDYSESITLIDGVVDGDIYVEDRDATTLRFLDTEYGNNTRIIPTIDTNNDAVSRRKSGFSFLANSASHKIHWSGSICSTAFGLIDTSKVISSAQGDYADKITYDESDVEVLWRETKTMTAIADKGYYVSKIIVDGETVEEFEANPSQGRVSYTFNEVVSDHEIIFEALPLPESDTSTVVDNPPTSDGIWGKLLMGGGASLAAAMFCLSNRRRG